MKRLLLPTIVLFLLASCSNDQPKSGTSSNIITQTKNDDTKSTDAEIDNSDKTAGVIDSTNSDFLYEVEREQVEQKATQELANREEKLVRVSGTLIGGAGMTITLDKLGGKTNIEPIKTTIINEDGYFELDAKTSQEQIFSLRTDSGNMILFLDEGNYNVKADVSKLSQYQVNAPMSYKVRDFYLILEEFNGRNEKILKREERYTKAKKAWKVQRILDSMSIYNAIIEEERAEAIKNFIDNNRNSPFAAEAANRLDFLKHTAYVENLYNELVVKYPYSSYVKNTGLKLVRFKALAVGKEAPSITMPDYKAVNHRLSDSRGKTTLIVISLSYSDPCLSFAKELIPLYNKYKSSFEVYNVSLDETQESWKYYLDQTQAPWTVVSDMMGQNSTVFDHYVAHDYPMTYLVDKKGIIADKFITIKELEEYLSKNK